MPTLLLSRTCQPEADQFAILARAEGWRLQWLHRRETPDHLHGEDFAYYGCSGLLGCDLSEMLPALRRACWRRDQLSDADAEWIVDRPA